MPDRTDDRTIRSLVKSSDIVQVSVGVLSRADFQLTEFGLMQAPYIVLKSLSEKELGLFRSLVPGEPKDFPASSIQLLNSFHSAILRFTWNRDHYEATLTKKGEIVHGILSSFTKQV